LAGDITPEQITAWRQSPHYEERIAAWIAQWAQRRPSGTALPPNALLAQEIGFIAPDAYIDTAKRLLTEKGALDADGDGFHVP
jgi:hypothetical protein